MKNLTLNLEISEPDAEVLRLLGRHSYIASDDPGDVLQLVIDHVLDGVRRPGSWECGWVRQLFGDDWEAPLFSDANSHNPTRKQNRHGGAAVELVRKSRRRLTGGKRRVKKQSVGRRKRKVQEVNDPILTAEEVAEDLRISKSHVHKLLRGQVEGAKTLPHLAVGRRKVVPRSALERWKRDSISDYGERDG